jgi:hypothetical protein
MDFSHYMNIKVMNSLKIDDQWNNLMLEGNKGGINSVSWAPSLNPTNNQNVYIV